MKNLKKLMALAIAGMMVVGSMSVVSAQDPAPVTDTTSFDNVLTVKDTAAGDTISFYKVIQWVDNADNNVRGWMATDHYASVLTEDVLKAILGVQADGTVDATKATGITSDIAGELARLAATDTAVQSGTESTLNVATTAKCGPGTYLALINPADPDTVYNPVIVSSDFTTPPAGEISVTASYPDAVVKKSTTELDKTASTSEDAWDDKEWNTTAIGDTVSFTVVTTIPGYGDVYQNPHFAVNDKLTYLTLKTDTVTVTVPTGLTKGTEYTVTPNGTTGYKLEFSADYLKTIKTPTSVTIKYDAIVSTSAPVHVNAEKNEVSTEYSHVPSSENDYAFKKDTTQHYTFTLDASGLGGGSTQSGKKTSELVKVGQNPDGSPITSEKVYSEVDDREYYQGPLEGAEFKLYTKEACADADEYIPKKTDGTEGEALKLTSGSDGRFEIKGLDAGTYYLKETKAPAGYVKDSSVHTIVIDADYDKDVEITEYTKDGVTWISEEDYNALSDKTGYKSYTYKTDILKSYTVKVDGEDTATYNFTNKGTDAEIEWTNTPPVEKPFDIINTKGVELPSTGGIGTTIFYIVGAILVLGAGVVLVTRRRMSAN